MDSIKCANPRCRNRVSKDWTRGCFVGKKKVCWKCGSDPHFVVNELHDGDPEELQKWIDAEKLISMGKERM